MKLGILGYGKMGKTVEQQALMRGHTVQVLNLNNLSEDLQSSDVQCAIDFSHADIAMTSILQCFKAGVSVVSGTTGWNDGVQQVSESAEKHGVAFCWAPNFSLGMHITFYLNKVLAKIMNTYPEYSPSMLEIHHTQKKDSPSGTAIALAEQLISNIDRIKSWKETVAEETGDVLSIEAKREEDVKGIHRVSYSGPFDTISLRHHAISRDGFAAGAVLAAEKLQGMTGNHEFDALLGFGTTK